MKKLIVPLAVAVLAGLGGGSGVAYVSAKKTAVVAEAHRVDSVKAHAKDSTEKAEKAPKIVVDSAHVDSSAMIPLTPADSIRAAKNLPTTLSEATHGLPNAPDPKLPAVATKTEAKVVEPPKVAEVLKAKPGLPVPKPAPTPATETPKSAAAVIEAVLPEKRVAKIFAAMQTKDAARVLEQMNDADVRVILSLMADKQAAAILATFPPQRAAAISKGDKKPNGVTP